MKDKFISKFPIKQPSTTAKFLCCSSLITLVLLVSPPVSSANNREITPERDISVVRNAPYSPDWKILWDGARNLAREGQLVLAADAYGQLFAVKPNIEEANWEYCKILLRINSFATASKISALLLEKNPNKIEYLLVAGQAAAQQKKYIEAERYFGLIFEKDPAGKYSDAALSGLAYSLRARGLKELSFPLLSQLATRQPNNTDVTSDLAADAVSLQKIEIARQLYTTLLSDKEVKDTTIFQAVSVFKDPEFEAERNALYSRYLQLHPNYLPFRLNLIDVHGADGKYEKVLTHLTYIIENSDDRDEYLLKAADIAENKLNRPDKALDLLEQYRSLHPEKKEIIVLIGEIQEAMARDFLSIVQNGGAELLWDDLASISSNRQFIFERMADLLENERKKQSLIDVLQIQHKNTADNSELSLKLADLLYDQKQYQKSLEYLQQVQVEDQSYDYYQLKSELELRLGLEVEALESLIECLTIYPQNQHDREVALGLAGRLGRVEDQILLFEDGVGDDFSKIPVELLKSHIEMLILNKIYGKALDLCERAIAAHIAEEDSVEFYLLKTEILRKSGRSRHAEQLLRELLYQEKFEDRVLFELVENSLDDQKTLNARKWFDQFEKMNFVFSSSNKALNYKLNKLLTEIRLLRQEDDADEAFNRIDKGISLTKAGKGSGDVRRFYTAFLKEKYLLYLATGDTLSADKLFSRSEKIFNFDPELIARRQMYSKPTAENVENKEFQSYYASLSTVVDSKLMDLADKQIEKQNFEDAEQTLKLIGNDLTASVRLSNIEIALGAFAGDYETAESKIKSLEKIFPGEEGFCRQTIDLSLKEGRSEEALDNFRRCFPERALIQSAIGVQSHMDVEVEILYARLLWSNKQFEDSLDVYSKLLDPSINKKLIDEFNAKNIDYQYLTRHQTFWNSMMLLMESDPDIIAKLMDPVFLVDNIGNMTGDIVSSNYEMYSWQSLIEDEFLARKAIFNKNYHFAAKSYEKLLEQEKSTENQVDLATIYGRIGEFRKEAQVYEEIANEGEVPPELQESIKRNILQIRPTNTFDAILEERDGRQGVVDIRKTSIGTTFWFTPDLDMDFWFKYAYNNYESTNRNQDTASNVLLGAMNYEFWDTYELKAGIGTEKFTDSNNSETQYNIEFNGQLDDYVSGFIHYEKQPVDDTVAALKDNIYRRFIQTGMDIETELGISFGGDLQYSFYSDDNESNRFYLFSSYSIFGESLRFDARYSYQHLANKDTNGPDGIYSDNVNEDYVNSYWSPDHYSEHRIGLQLKKDFFGYLTDLENKMSYVSLDTGLSLEDEETVAFSATFDIFLEMSPHLLLKGNFSFNTSDVYKDKILSLSLHYSW